MLLDDGTLAAGPARESLYGFAYTMLQAARIETAVKAFRVLVRFAPTDERGWLGLAACHEQVGEDEIACALYRAGAMAAAPAARCHLALARLDGDREQLDAAEAAAADDEALLRLVARERVRS